MVGGCLEVDRVLRGDDICGVAVERRFNFRVLCGALLSRGLLLGLAGLLTWLSGLRCGYHALVFCTVSCGL